MTTTTRPAALLLSIDEDLTVKVLIAANNAGVAENSPGRYEVVLSGSARGAATTDADMLIVTADMVPALLLAGVPDRWAGRIILLAADGADAGELRTAADLIGATDTVILPADKDQLVAYLKCTRSNRSFVSCARRIQTGRA